MRAILCVLSLWLATPAFAHSLEVTLCKTARVPVAQMAESEKLCRSFAVALAEVPQAVSEEVRAMLTPQSLAAMMTLSAAWMGAQGIPVVGQTVDAVLLVLGVALLSAQAADLTNALWAYVNLTISARSHTDLEAASAHLSRAIALVGVNAVVFILTKDAAGTIRPGPPTPRLAPAPVVVGRPLPTPASPSRTSPVAIPAFAAMGTRPEVHREFPATGPGKVPDPEAFGAWIRQTKRRRVQQTKSDASRFQLEHTGEEEFLIKGGGKEVWADGHRSSEAYLLEVKHVEKPEISPFIPGSSCSDAVRNLIRDKELDQFSRYAAVLKDPTTPAVGLEVILNDARAIPFFESLMKGLGIPGRIVISEGKSP